MIASVDIPFIDNLQARFLTLLPRIETHARIYFRDVVCSETRAERIAETVAVSWRWFVRLAERGKDAAEFVSALASLAARSVRAGGRLCGGESAKDVMSPVAQRRHAFIVERLPEKTRFTGKVWDEALQDNTRTPPDEQACFRIDFPEWLDRRTERDRQVIDAMMLGEHTKNLSRRFGVSSGRISQMRREYHEDWLHFQGDSLLESEKPISA